MSRIKKQIQKFILILLIIIVLLASFIGAGLYNGGAAVIKTDSIGVLGKIKDLQEKGGKFELTQKNIDEATSMYFANPKVKGDVTLKGVNLEMLNNKLLIEAPISYKNINLLFSSKGELNLSNGDIVFDAENFKIGKIKIPKKLVISQISKLDNKNISVKDNSIKISRSVVPLKLKEFKIVDNKILGTVEKIDRKVALKEVEKNLGNSKSKVETLKEKEIISKVISIMSKMESDPSYDASPDVASVKADYARLDSTSQGRVKYSVVSNVDPGSIGVLRQTFGM